MVIELFDDTVVLRLKKQFINLPNFHAMHSKVDNNGLIGFNTSGCLMN